MVGSRDNGISDFHSNNIILSQGVYIDKLSEARPFIIQCTCDPGMEMYRSILCMEPGHRYHVFTVFTTFRLNSTTLLQPIALFPLISEQTLIGVEGLCFCK